MTELSHRTIEELLSAVGDLLQHQEELVSIVIVGGAALSLGGVVERTTQDVDVLARVEGNHEERILVRPEPLPQALIDAIARVARDFGLPADWMNTVVGRQWQLGAPPVDPDRIEWRRYGSLEVGLPDRRGLIALKLFASVDRGPDSVHYQDLLALEPTSSELQWAREWVVDQDVGTGFSSLVDEVVEHVRNDTETD